MSLDVLQVETSLVNVNGGRKAKGYDEKVVYGQHVHVAEMRTRYRRRTEENGFRERRKVRLVTGDCQIY